MPLLLWLVLWLHPECPAIPATVVRVIDADTLEMRAEPWPDLQVAARIRVLELWAPERHTPAGRDAAVLGRGVLNRGPVSVRPTGARSFERLVGRVCVGPFDYAAILRTLGQGTRAKPGLEKED